MATEAWNEIKNQDVWYHSDLKLIVVILFTLPLETVISICDEVIDRLNDTLIIQRFFPPNINYSLI